jgi:hypothetical protein
MQVATACTAHKRAARTTLCHFRDEHRVSAHSLIMAKPQKPWKLGFLPEAGPGASPPYEQHNTAS